jgi:hypothetical protein
MVGKQELKAAGECLNYMSAGLAEKTPGQQWHRISHRVLQDIQHRCMLRTAPEEVNLSINAHAHDVMNAEFVRTFMSQDFPGGQLVKRLEHELNEEMERRVNKVVPVRMSSLGQAPIFVHNFEDIYGFRGEDPRVYYLSPWEFLMHWELVPLRPPSQQSKVQPENAKLTKWSVAWLLVVVLFYMSYLCFCDSICLPACSNSAIYK